MKSYSLKIVFLFFMALSITTSSYAGIVTYNIGSSTDSVEEATSGGLNTTSSDLELPYDGSTQQIIGLRFVNVSIPQGTTIINAYLVFEVDEDRNDDAYLNIYGEDSDNSVTFSNSDLVSTRPLTGAIAWSITDNGLAVGDIYNTPSITSIIQTIVNRPSWMGDALSIIIKDNGTLSGKRQTAVSGNTKLVVEYDGSPAACFNYDTDDENCNVISFLDNVSTATSGCVIGSTSNSETNKEDYYQFTAGDYGILDITTSSPNGNAYYMSVGSSCGADDHYGTPAEISHIIPQITLAPNETIYFYFKETGDDTDEYQVNFNFELAPFQANDDQASVNPGGEVSIDILDNDSPGSGNTIDVTSVIISTDPMFGTYIVDSSTGEIVYTAQNNYTGIDVIEYTVKNSAGITSNTAKVSITVGLTPGDRDFTVRNPKDSQNIKGNYKIAGSLSLCEDDGTGNCRADNGNSNSNDDIYVDIDSDTNTSNSSSSTIDIPLGSKVLWAGLYWQGVVHRSRSEDGGDDFMGGTVPDDAPLLGGSTNQIDLTNDTYGANQVKLKIPSDIDNNDSYRLINSNQLDYSDLGYGGFAEITDILSDNPNGTYMIADVKCHEGAEPNHGNYGAWSLVVIYENEDETLKNITLFDGFATIDSGYNSDLVIDGFLTPSSAPIKSKIAFFTMDGEGGTNSLTIISETNGAKLVEHLPENPGSSLFNSTVTGVDNRLPDVGPMRFDLDIIEIDDYLAPFETKATLQPRSGGDRYTASFFIMSTELYEPRVCYYIDTIVDENSNNIFEDGKFIEDITSGADYTFNIWISNMKKETTDINLETARLVQVYLGMTDFNYVNGSTSIRNLSESSYLSITDAIDTDIGEYSNNFSTWRVGLDANATQGGDLAPADLFSDDSKKAFVTFTGSLDTPNASDIDLVNFLDFTASFETDSVTIRPQDAKALYQCQDLNSSGSTGSAPGGYFNVVMTNQTADIINDNADPLADDDSTLNALPTQISNKDIDISIVSLDDDYITPKSYKGLVSLELIAQPNYAVGDSEAQKILKCENAVKYSPVGSEPTNTYAFAVSGEEFSHVDTNGAEFSHPNAYKDATFRVRYLKDTSVAGATEWNCAANTFNCLWGMLVRTYGNNDDTPCQSSCNPAGVVGNAAASEACISCVFGPSNTGVSCARDNFALRPEKLELTFAGTDPELLTSALDYYFSLTALQYNSTIPTLGYTIANITNGIYTMLSTLYNPDNSIGSSLAGTLSFSATPFNMLDGISVNNTNVASANVGLNFNDVGKVNIELQDTTWAQVDIDSGDNVAECNNTAGADGKVGAYVCGDINATFIPDHFLLSAASLKNASASTFTYLSNDLNMSAGFDVTITAENALNATTTNFDSTAWENPVNIAFTLPAQASMVENKSEISTSQNLIFATGVKTINYSDSNLTTNLVFNFNRTNNVAVNPFIINGSTVDINASSLYTSSSGATATVIGGVNPDQNATFLYGRTHAPRHRFTGPSGTALIYYEIHCDGTINANACDKTLLPNGINSKTSDDPRWFINPSHLVTTGVVGTVTQKGTSGLVTATTPTGTNIANVALTYGFTSKGYPYKATMENNASSWLIYNPYDANDDDNDFEVEFTNSASSWAGQKETDTVTNRNASDKTNRRSMW